MEIVTSDNDFDVPDYIKSGLEILFSELNSGVKND